MKNGLVLTLCALLPEVESRALKEAEGLLARVRGMPPPAGCTSVPGF